MLDRPPELVQVARPLPAQPIDRLLRPITRFLRIESMSGVVLLVCTAIALFAANSSLAEPYLAFWQTEVTLGFGEFQFEHSLHHVINDGLMVVFFFVVGLEVKGELTHGSLSDWKNASLPIAAAIGGMVVPASIYLMFQYGEAGMRGWGIPMATDIAFVVGCLAILGPRVPHNLRILLLSLAITDDIGAILVIAIGYTDSVNLQYLLLAALCLGVVQIFSRIGIRRFPPYIAAGAVAWIALHESGVHATLTGVVLGLMTPAKSTLIPERFRAYLVDKRETFQDVQWEHHQKRAEVVRDVQRLTRETVSPLEYLEMILHPWSAFVIMPIFALANAAVVFELANITDSIALAVTFGLFVGKPIGILLMCWIVIRLGIAKMPEGVNWPILAAGSCLAGIGFTMALFIDGLAFSGDTVNTAKTGILVGSGLSAMLGLGLLLWVLPKGKSRTDAP